MPTSDLPRAPIAVIFVSSFHRDRLTAAYFNAGNIWLATKYIIPRNDKIRHRLVSNYTYNLFKYIFDDERNEGLALHRVIVSYGSFAIRDLQGAAVPTCD